MLHTRLSLVLIAFALVVAACSTDSDATSPPAAASLIKWNNLGINGLDRCEWSGSGDSQLESDCIAAEASATADASQDQHDLDEQLTASLGSGDPNCLFIEDEFVSPAPLSVVTDHTDANLIPEVGELPGGLFAYETTDPREAVRALLEANIPASLRYFVVPTQRWKFGPGSVALPADPGVVAGQGSLTFPGSGRVSVIDTGAAGLEPPELDPMFVGHGEFISGIIRRLAPPPVTVTERSAFGGSGAMPTEHDVIEEIKTALAGELARTDEDPVTRGVVNLSLGTYACEPGQIPLELAAFLGELVLAGEDVVFVAAAGNDGAAAAPFWPAGFSDPMQFGVAVDDWTERHAELDLDEPYPGFIDALNALRDAQDVEGAPIVVGVGALVDTANGWEPAAFSNQVGATVWAPGANIVSNYPASQEPDWQGFAQWDGTSFAAPHVSALIAGCFDPGNLSHGYRDILANVLSQGGC